VEINKLQDHPFSVVVDGKVVTKTVRLFLGGDYEFLCEVFDQSNAASTSFCIWCPVTKEGRRDDPFEMDGCWGEEGKEHTLESLKARARKKRSPVFPFQLDRVVVLPLHITLGLTAAYLTMLKQEVT
jgi:hypothetical protein